MFTLMMHAKFGAPSCKIDIYGNCWYNISSVIYIFKQNQDQSIIASQVMIHKPLHVCNPAFTRETCTLQSIIGPMQSFDYINELTLSTIFYILTAFLSIRALPHVIFVVNNHRLFIYLFILFYLGASKYLKISEIHWKLLGNHQLRICFSKQIYMKSPLKSQKI